MVPFAAQSRDDPDPYSLPAEQSCVVYGMPRSVVEAGLSDASASLEDLFDVILEKL